MANLNVKGSVIITGSLHGTYKGSYCTDMDSISNVYDSGWLDIPESPWLNKNNPRGFGTNYAKFRVVNNIVFINIFNNQSVTIPIWRETQNITPAYFGTIPTVLRPTCHYRWMADPLDSTGYEISVTLDRDTGTLYAVCLGGSKAKNVMSLCVSYPTDGYTGVDRIDQGLKSMYD